MQVKSDFVRSSARAASPGHPRPAPLNLIVPEMVEGIRATFDALRRDLTVRAAIINRRGAGHHRRDCSSRSARVHPGHRQGFIASLHEAINLVHDAPFRPSA